MLKKFVKYLIKNNITIATYESFTGGYFSHCLTNISGASKIFLGGIIVYTKQAKINVGHVNQKTIAQYGVISKQTALKMLTACNESFHSDIAVSFTGNAGPTAMENKKVGAIFIGLKIFDNYQVISLRLKSFYSRKKIKKIAVKKIIKEILFNVINK